jgi:hypothetical protein
MRDHRFIRILPLLLAGLLLGGCGDDEPVVTEPEMTPAEIAAARKKAQIEALETKVENLLQNVDKFPDRWEELLLNVEGYLVEAQWFGSETSRLASRLEGARTKINARRDDAAAQRLATVVAEADQLAGEEAYDEAVEALEAFDPEERFAETPSMKAWEAKRDDLLRYAEAEIDYRRITGTARAYRKEGVLESLAKSVALLETFPEEFAETSYGREIREMIDETFAEYRELKSVEDEILNVPTVAIEIEEYLGNFRTIPSEDVWTVEGDELVGDNGSGQPALLMFGDKNWKSFQVQFWIKAPADQEFRLGATVIPSFRPGQQDRAETYEVATGTDEWIELLITYRAGTARFQDLTSGDKLLDDVNPRGDTASISVGLLPGQEIRIRQIRARVFERYDASAEEEDDGGDGDDDDDDEDEDE